MAEEGLRSPLHARSRSATRIRVTRHFGGEGGELADQPFNGLRLARTAYSIAHDMENPDTGTVAVRRVQRQYFGGKYYRRYLWPLSPLKVGGGLVASYARHKTCRQNKLQKPPWVPLRQSGPAMLSSPFYWRVEPAGSRENRCLRLQGGGRANHIQAAAPRPLAENKKPGLLVSLARAPRYPRGRRYPYGPDRAQIRACFKGAKCQFEEPHRYKTNVRMEPLSQRHMPKGLAVDRLRDVTRSRAFWLLPTKETKIRQCSGIGIASTSPRKQRLSICPSN